MYGKCTANVRQIYGEHLSKYFFFFTFKTCVRDFKFKIICIELKMKYLNRIRARACCSGRRG